MTQAYAVFSYRGHDWDSDVLDQIFLSEEKAVKYIAEKEEIVEAANQYKDLLSLSYGKLTRWRPNNPVYPPKPKFRDYNDVEAFKLVLKTYNEICEPITKSHEEAMDQYLDELNTLKEQIAREVAGGKFSRQTLDDVDVEDVGTSYYYDEAPIDMEA